MVVAAHQIRKRRKKYIFRGILCVKYDGSRIIPSAYSEWEIVILAVEILAVTLRGAGGIARTSGGEGRETWRWNVYAKVL